MIRALLAACLLSTLAPGASAAEAPGTAYPDNLKRTLGKYGSVAQVPASSVAWLAKTFGKSSAEIVKDLAAQAPGISRSAAPARPAAAPAAAAKPVEIPAESWDDEPDLDPDYSRALEDVLAKYGTPGAVPDNSVEFLGKAWNMGSARIRRDLVRVKARSPHVVSDDMYSY